MATKKKTEVESTEEIKEVESIEAVEAAPKKTAKKSTSTKKKVEAEDYISEEPVAAEVTAEEAAPEIKEEPKKVEKKVESETKVPITVQVVSSAGIYTFNRPSIEASRGKVIPKGARFTINEVSGPWGKIGEDKWIMITGAVVKI